MIESASILIPTHNRSSILSLCLESLTHVQPPAGIDVELIVVGNCCSDETEAVVQDASHRMQFSTRFVVEDELGLNVARNRAVHEARGDVLAFLDDDVWVEPGWLAGLCDAYQQSRGDVIGGRTLLWWHDVAPPRWIDRRFETLLSGCDRGESGFVIDTSVNMGMVGANFSFSRAVLTRVGGFLPGLDRVGKHLLGGGETEFLRRARDHGFQFFYEPRACVKHLVTPEKLSVRYLRRLSFDFGRTASFLGADGRPMLAWAIVVGQPFRAAANLAGGMVSSIAGDQATALSRQLAGVQRLGRSVGALELLTGRSPLNRVAR